MQEFLSPEQINDFIGKGFVRIDNAFPAELAAEVRRILWNETGLQPDGPSTWKQPVIRLGYYTGPPFIAAANTPQLLGAYDQLVGPGKWLPCMNMGSMVLRFPSDDVPGDTGWHVDASFAGDDPGDPMRARINVQSKGRALLMLFLFSDVGNDDAPTRIRIGSHLDVARALFPFGEKGIGFMELAALLNGLPEREETLATGKAGTVYLCHPFLAHAGQVHHGKEPRFLAQPPLLPQKELVIRDTAGYEYSPVEIAIRKGIHTT